MVSGVRQSEHITPVLEDLHWLPVSQRVVCKTALMVCVLAAAISGRQHLRSVATGTLRDCNWTTKFRSQRTSHMEPSATSTTVTGRVGERLQAGTEDALVLDRPAPLRRLHVTVAGYKYPDLLTYMFVCSSSLSLVSHKQKSLFDMFAS